MKSLKLIDENNNYSFADETFLINSNLTNWKGWLCSVGQINIEIDENGSVYGGNCRQRLYYGNLQQSNFTFIPTKNFTICNQDICKCFHDSAKFARFSHAV